MNVIAAYHRLPAPARDAVSSLKGAWLRSWRYGPETEALVERALERDAWPPEAWKAWREERLARVLHRAATRVPFYRKHWEERRRGGDRRSWERLENWPLLTKDRLRAAPRAFLADDVDPRRMYRERTSGTTGLPLDLWWSRETVRAWFAIYEARIRRWNGVDRRDRWAILGGQPVVHPDARHPPFWVSNRPMRQLYLSANHVSPETAGLFVAELARRRPTHLVGYPSSLAFLAREAARQGLARPASLRVVVTNAEPLLPGQREAIAEGLCPEVRETYGMAEIAAAGSECPAGALHEWPEVGWIETWKDDADVAAEAGEPGRLVCTTLLNRDMPLVRYAVGDRGRAPAAGGCACGRRLPVFAAIEGRSNDLLIAPDGRRVFWVNPVFYGLPVREAQVVQQAPDAIRVRVVAAPGFGGSARRAIEEGLRLRLGSVRVAVEECDAIPRGPNGKFRAVVREFSGGGAPGEPREAARA
ncbi:MAG TPA: AMP-binding protein [Thermoanaerobaculia bacterium]|nr:AMP-binding protein [Thermoanaerobaculia bacterium]